MSSFWKAMVALAVVLPVTAYVAGSLAAGNEPAPVPQPVVLRESSASPSPSSPSPSSPSPSASRPSERSRGEGPRVVWPSPDDVHDRRDDPGRNGFGGPADTPPGGTGDDDDDDDDDRDDDDGGDDDRDGDDGDDDDGDDD